MKKKLPSMTNIRKTKRVNSSKIYKENTSNPISSQEIKDDISMISKNQEMFECINNFVTVGVIAHSNLLESREFTQLVNLFDADSKIKIKLFSIETIKNEKISSWDKVNVLLCHLTELEYLVKIKKYVELNNVFLLNDINKQNILQSRAKIYSLLEKYNLPVVKHIYIGKNNSDKENNYEVVEYDDYIQIGNQFMQKPFVEKPINSNDHNIYIYYSIKSGGGCKILYKKNGVFLSKYKKNLNTIRKNGQYIYEKYLPHDGFDIHIKTIGMNYFHAQASKSPTMEATELQSITQKPDVSFPVNLTMNEKTLCRKIVFLFGQINCQVDIIRSKGNSFVCDINGFSLRKTRTKFLNDFYFILRKQVYSRFFPFASLEPEIRPISKTSTSIEFKNIFSQKSRISLSTRVNSQLFSIKSKFIKNIEELHRIDSFPKLYQSFNKRNKSISIKIKRSFSQKEKNKKSVFKKNQQNKEFNYNNLSDMYSLKNPKKVNKSEKMRSIIGIFLHQDRHPKQKMKMITSDSRFLDFFNQKKKKKVLKFKSPSKLKKILKIAKEIISELSNYFIKTNENEKKMEKLKQLVLVLQEGKRISGINRKIQLKPLRTYKNTSSKQVEVIEALLVLKWGGNITHSGLKQAERFGNFFRENFYKNEREGLLRLHSTYRHDLKIYSSDEGRCQLTAAALTKGLLMIEDSLTPILSSFINSDRNTSKILDVTNRKKHLKKKSSSTKGKQVKSFLFSSEDTTSREKLIELYQVLHDFCSFIKQIDFDSLKKKKKYTLCHFENSIYFVKRWTKLCKDFHSSKNDSFDPSKLTNILDFIRY